MSRLPPWLPVALPVAAVVVLVAPTLAWANTANASTPDLLVEGLLALGLAYLQISHSSAAKELGNRFSQLTQQVTARPAPAPAGLRNASAAVRLGTSPEEARLMTDVGALKTDVGQLKTDVTQLKVDSIVTRSDLGRIEKQLGQLEQRIGALEKQGAAVAADVELIRADIALILNLMRPA